MSHTGERPGGGRAIMLLVAAVALALAALRGVDAARQGGFRDIPGDFCRNRRPSECCSDRYDDCAVPILGTYCYCDEFCFAGDHVQNDCCPDFWEVCLGETEYANDPPAPLSDGCDKDGVKIPEGESHKFNCNECTCERGEVRCEEDTCMIDETLVDQINSYSGHYGWRATNHSDFWGRKTGEGLLLKTGTVKLEQGLFPIKLLPNLSQIPKNFDARDKWVGRVSGIKDQGWCGASWAFSTLAVAQDRLSIVAKGLDAVTLSPQHLLSCIRSEEEPCQGGHVDIAWNFLRRNGAVTEDCYKYQSGQSGKVPPCPIRSSRDLSARQCPVDQQNFYKTEPAYRVSNQEEDIMWEILNMGPLQALMTVHTDLFMYESGIYSPSGLGDPATAPHSVRIVGWGEEVVGNELAKYWVVANSWGSDWGENGFFRIRRGQNVADIESYIIAVRTRLANLVYGIKNGNGH